MTKNFNKTIPFNYELTTTYDPVTKIWSGSERKSYYDPNCALGRLFFEEMRRNPQRVCLIYDPTDLVMTNDEVRLQAICVANFFKSRGLTQRDIVAVVASNTPYVTAIVLGCFFSGCIFQGINPMHDTKISKSLFDQTKPKLIFCDGNIYNKMKIATTDITTEIVTVVDHIEGVQNIMDLLVPTDNAHEFVPADLLDGPDQTVAILCSSGSTGVPKPITLSNNAKVYEFMDYLTSEDVIYASSTVDWMSGYIYFMSSIIYGATRITSDIPFSADYFFHILEKYKITSTISAPSQLSALINSPLISVEKMDSIRHIYFGGGKCTIATQKKMQSYLRNGRICFSYGFTEAASICTRNFQFEAKPNSTGRLLPGYRLKIVNAVDATKVLGPNEVGEILVKSNRIWNGYYGKSSVETKNFYNNDGWILSGDLGYIDEDGYLFIVERKKDSLKYRAMMYYPNEIEEVIAELPDVVDVCVIGVWTEEDGDLAGAVVVKSKGSTLTAKDVENYAARNIEAIYKQLYAGALVVDELPKHPNGKINRQAVKELFINKKYNKNKQ